MIAELGYQRTSFVEIAKRAPLSSTRLISYHFRDRDELMAAVATDVIGQLAAAVEVRVRAAGSPADAVRAFIDANVGYMSEHRAQMVALTALTFAGAVDIAVGEASASVEALTAIIAAGRQSGQFRDVDAAVAATIVQRAVEGVPMHLRKHPDADLSAHASELVRFFDAALLRSAPDSSAE